MLKLLSDPSSCRSSTHKSNETNTSLVDITQTLNDRKSSSTDVNTRFFNRYYSASNSVSSNKSQQSSGLGTLTTASSLLGSSSNLENNVHAENRLAYQNSSAHSSNSNISNSDPNESKL